MFSCVKQIQKPTPLPPPESKPVFNKTFGAIRYVGLATLIIEYKNMNILIDPCFDSTGSLGMNVNKLMASSESDRIMRLIPPSFGVDALPPLDYLLLTDTQATHFGATARDKLRKSLKILGPPSILTQLTQSGFNQAKGLSSGQKLLLQKEGTSVFATALQSRNPVSGQVVNGYLLEFDNGRNIFISGEIVDLAVFREFLYGLRDDGKEIYMAFLYSGSLQTADDKALQSMDESMAAEVTGLLQPNFSVLLQTDSLNITQFQPAKFQEALANQIFSGTFFFPKSGDLIEF